MSNFYGSYIGFGGGGGSAQLAGWYGTIGITGMGGYYPNRNEMDYITIATQANAIDFGDLTSTSGDGAGVSNGPRGVFQLGYAGPPVSNRMDYITIATTGNAADFGDLTVSRGMSGAAAGD